MPMGYRLAVIVICYFVAKIAQICIKSKFYSFYFSRMLSSRQFTVILPDGTTKTISYHGHPITSQLKRRP